MHTCHPSYIHNVNININKYIRIESINPKLFFTKVRIESINPKLFFTKVDNKKQFIEFYKINNLFLIKKNNMKKLNIFFNSMKII